MAEISPSVINRITLKHLELCNADGLVMLTTSIHTEIELLLGATDVILFRDLLRWIGANTQVCRRSAY